MKRRLGKLVTIINCPTSVGGLPDRGVPDAIIKIRQAMDPGATWFVRSDLKDFFQAVPKKEIASFLTENISDTQFNELFLKALATELENEDEVRELLHLFPIGDLGVPQGSALSALCANIVLSQFDSKMNGRGVTTIRYLDDFIILGKGKKSTEAAFRAGAALLKSLGFECHDPFDRKSKKASSGAVNEGMQFLSFDISPTRIAPSKDAANEFLSDIDDAISDGRKAISESENIPRRAQPRFVQTLSLLNRKIRGWGDAFSATTDRVLFAQLDERVERRLNRFRQWFAKRINTLDDRQKRRLLGVALLLDTPPEETQCETV